MKSRNISHIGWKKDEKKKKKFANIWKLGIKRVNVDKQEAIDTLKEAPFL